MKAWLMAISLCTAHMAAGLDWVSPGPPNIAFGLSCLALIAAWLEEATR